MSYDYNTILHSIQNHRQQAYANSEEIDLESLSAAVEEFSTLASYCSLTPALWLLYAKDAAELMAGLLNMEDDSDDGDETMGGSENLMVQKSEMSVQTLGTAIQEFPGCAKLRYYYLFHKVILSLAKLKNSDSDAINVSNDMELEEEFEEAVQWVGSGSHPQSEHAANVWRLWVEYSAMSSDLQCTKKKQDFHNVENLSKTKERIAKLLVRRACLPLIFNSGLGEEIEGLQSGRSILPGEESRILSQLVSLQYLTNLSMITVHILPKYLYQLPKEEIFENEMEMSLLDAIEYGRRSACKSPLKSTVISQHEVAIQALMYKDNIIDVADAEGDSSVLYTYYNHVPLMGMATEATSTAFIAYAQEFKKQKNCNTMPSMSILIYERAISECITQEGLWLSYVINLLREKKYEQAANICRRACRNCPYSTRLFALNMQATHLVSIHCKLDFDSSQIIAIARAAFDLQFFPGGKDDYLEIYLEYTRTIRRELLRIAFKGAEDMLKQAINIEFKYMPYVEEKVYNLVSDLRQSYDQIDSFLKQEFENWHEGRSKLFYDRAYCEAFIIRFLYNQPSIDKEGDRYIKAAANIDPGNAKIWLDSVKYIFLNSCSFERNETLSRSPLLLRSIINKTRSCFKKGLSSLSKMRKVEDLATLSNEFLCFERMHGSGDDCMNAVKFVRGRIKGTNLILSPNSTSVIQGQIVQPKVDDIIVNKRKVGYDSAPFENEYYSHNQKRCKKN